MKNVSAVIAAAGSGSRMGKDKMLMKLGDMSVIEHTVGIFCRCENIAEIIVAASKGNASEIKDALIKRYPENNITVIIGGKTRAETSFKGIKKASCEYVLIHDGARPLTSDKTVSKCIKAAYEYGCAAAGVFPKDTIKILEGNNIKETLSRKNAFSVRTPQIFLRSDILNAYENHMSSDDTDDCSVYEKAGGKIYAVECEYENIKLTTKDDIMFAENILGIKSSIPIMRVGTGFDSHMLTYGRRLIIGGVDIPYEKGLLGHSDADVLIHAVIDALLGGCSLGNIGQHFPNTDEQFKDISSMVLLEKTAGLLKNSGYTVSNIDTTIIIQKPKLAPYVDEMKKNIAAALSIPENFVSVKAKTNEGMGFTGRGEGVEARACVCLMKTNN